MKLILALFAVLAVFGLGQAHKVPRPLHEAIQNILDTIPKDSPTPGRTLIEEFMDFVKLIPSDKFIDIFVEYVNHDQKVVNTLNYLFTPEFHQSLRDVEVLDEHLALIVYIEKSGLHVIEAIQEFHRAIGMDEYWPPKIEDWFKSKIGVQAVGEGLTAMLNDLAAVLPTKELQALYDEKMATTNAFSSFVKKVTSPEMKKLLSNLYGHPTHQKLYTNCLEQGLDLKAVAEFFKKIIPIPIPTPDI